jgi:hypothetical protein
VGVHVNIYTVYSNNKRGGGGKNSCHSSDCEVIVFTRLLLPRTQAL